MARDLFKGTAAICALEACEKKAAKNGLVKQMGEPTGVCLCCGHTPVVSVVKFDSEADFQRTRALQLGKVKRASKVPHADA